MTRVSKLILVTVLLCTVGCTSSSRTSDREPGYGLSTKASNRTIRNAHIILHQGLRTEKLVLVNRSNVKRKTKKGRMSLSLGDPSLACKILEDADMAKLLDSFENYDSRLIEESWQPADERLLEASRNSLDGFRGVIVVENAGVKKKYVGWKASGNPIKLRRFKVFSNMKTTVAVFNNFGIGSELP